MTRYFVVRDGKIEASCGSYENALALIREYQAKETHYLLKANFSIITGVEENIPYK
jgi:hypothetical protein